MQKLDPYINVDPDDEPVPHGSLRYRRRRRDRPRPRALRAVHRQNLHRESNATTGSIYSSVLARSRRRLLATTVQVIPQHHQRDQAAHPVAGSEDVDVSSPRSAARWRHRDPAVPRGHPAVPQGRGATTLHIHVTLVPFIAVPRRRPSRRSTPSPSCQPRIQPAPSCVQRPPGSEALKRKTPCCPTCPEAVVAPLTPEHLRDPARAPQEASTITVRPVAPRHRPAGLTAWRRSCRPRGGTKPVRSGSSASTSTCPTPTCRSRALKHGAPPRRRLTVDWIQARGRGLLTEGRLRDLDAS